MLLEAAYREMYLHGFQGTSLDAILTATGLSKGAMYYHFENKQALGLAVINELIGNSLRDDWFTPLQTSTSPLCTLDSLIESHQTDATESTIRLGCPLNNLMQEMSPIDESFRTALAALLEEWRSTIESALRRARARNQIKPEVDCRTAAYFIIAGIEGCTGISKNNLDVEEYRTCLAGVRQYLDSLRMD